MKELDWGRRYLVCAPTHFDVLYTINPWMSADVEVDLDVARGEWNALVHNLECAGAEVSLIDSAPALPDMVFTANAGVVNGNQYVSSRFRHSERQGETPLNIRWFEEHGYDVATLPPEISHEGSGDALPFRGIFLTGYRMRSDARAHIALSTLTGAPFIPLELVDPRFYHIDLSFCPLSDTAAIINPAAWDSYGRRVVQDMVPDPLVLSVEEAETFCMNSVVVGSTIIMPACPLRVGRRLEAWGFDVVVSPVDEFLKAGGGCRCLTLALDIDF